MLRANYLFLFPLDHPLQWTSDYQLQTINVINKEYPRSVVLYHAYHPRKTWRNLLIPTFWKSVIAFFSHWPSQKELHFYPIHLIPFEQWQPIYSLNKKLSFFLVFLLSIILIQPSKVIFWIFHPRFYEVVELPKKMFKHSTLLYYDCLDYFELLDTKEERTLRKLEYSLLKTADLVTANSHALAKKHSAIRGNILTLPSGFRYSDFHSYKGFASFKKSKKQSVIYVGTINYRLDFPLLEKVIKDNAQWEFYLIGPIDTTTNGDVHDIRQQLAKLFSYKNCFHLKYISPQKLPQFFLQASVGIIPYTLSSSLNKYCNPLKLLEYFYFGLPVVATPLPSLKEHTTPFLQTSQVARTWSRYISHSIAHPPHPADQKKLREIALQNTWERKISVILQNLLLLEV
jgi:glycosyltransferase involved in cell wall biosynthesis